MDLSEIKIKLQEFFTDGLLTIVGCGLSSSEGIPGMQALSEHLRKNIPLRAKNGILDEWKNVDSLLNDGLDIETAMHQQSPSDALEKIIQDLTGELILEAESKVVEEILLGERELRFSKLLNRILIPRTGAPIITTNYDRLLEIASEVSGLGVDSLFVGHYIGKLNEKESKFSFCRDANLKKSRVRLDFAKHVILMKPHGSLDWYLHKDEPIRYPIPLSLPRLMITPGLNKYRNGYERPFDIHRGKANIYIDRAARFLIIGYGFNDSHLETHLSPKLKEGKAALIITRTLSENAKKIISECQNVIAVSESNEADVDGTSIIFEGKEFNISGVNLWDLGDFVKEVLEP